MTSAESSDVNPYLIEKELERRSDHPLEELRALLDAVSGALDDGEISDELFDDFLEQMGIDLEYNSYWAEDWEFFELQACDRATYC